MLGTVSEGIRNWMIRIFVRAIASISREEDRTEALNWLIVSRDILASEQSAKSKYIELYRNIDTSKSIKIVFNGVAAAVKNYKTADLPLAVKVALPLTLAALPIAGGHSAGIAAFGSAIGVPVLLLIFLGSAGVTSIIEACANSVDTRAFVEGIMQQIVRDEALRKMRADIKNGVQGVPEHPMRSTMPENEMEISDSLLKMDPYNFEHHVMSYFRGDLIQGAYVTRKSADKGVDGFAKHAKGIIVVQCKRYALGNLVSGPEIQQFRGAMEYHKAWRGFFVTTSGFTRQACDYLEKFDNMVSIDMQMLIGWHRMAPNFDYL